MRYLNIDSEKREILIPTVIDSVIKHLLTYLEKEERSTQKTSLIDVVKEKR